MLNSFRTRLTWTAFASFLVLVISSAAMGQGYDDMVAKVRGGDNNVDFRAMRMAFTQTQQFATGIDPKIRTKLADSLKAKKADEMVKAAQEILKTDFVNPNVHYLAARAYQMLKDEKKAQYHTAIYVGLVNSILKEGDGETAKTAYQVISEDEQTAVLTALELQRTGQSSTEEGGHRYTVVAVTDQAKASSKVYFNVDKMPAKAAEIKPQ